MPAKYFGVYTPKKIKTPPPHTIHYWVLYAIGAKFTFKIHNSAQESTAIIFWWLLHNSSVFINTHREERSNHLITHRTQ